jgi:CYTH domain-containing protein
VLDLFCGLGNFTLPLARACAKWSAWKARPGWWRGRRRTPSATAWTTRSSSAADLTQDQRGTPWMRQGFDKLLLDPPRSGAIEVLQQLPLKQFKRIVYVSCHPGSLARDAGYLVNEQGFTLKRPARWTCSRTPRTWKASRCSRSTEGAVTVGIEIERKFLVTGDGWRAAADKVTAMAQGYLSGPPSMEAGTEGVCARARAGRCSLQHQVGADGREPAGVRIPGPGGRGARAAGAVRGGIVDKRRHYVRHAGHLWEVDEFLGDNAGLVVAEIELQREDEPFEKPTGPAPTSRAVALTTSCWPRGRIRWTPAEQRRGLIRHACARICAG